MPLPYLTFPSHTGPIQNPGSTSASFLEMVYSTLEAAGLTVERLEISATLVAIGVQFANEDVADMRVVFYARSSSSSIAMFAPATEAANLIHVAVYRGITTASLGDGSISGNLYGQGYSPGFIRCSMNSSFANSDRFFRVMVSGESLMAVFSPSDSTHEIVYAGAAVNPHSTRFRETNGRLYGVLCGRITGATIWGATAATTTVFMSGNSAGGPDSYVIDPNSEAGVRISRWSQFTHAPSAAKMNPSSETVGHSIAMALDSERTNTPIGTVRQVYYWADGLMDQIQHENTGTIGSPVQGDAAVRLISQLTDGTGDTLAVPLKDLRV